MLCCDRTELFSFVLSDTAVSVDVESQDVTVVGYIASLKAEDARFRCSLPYALTSVTVHRCRGLSILLANHSIVHSLCSIESFGPRAAHVRWQIAPRIRENVFQPFCSWCNGHRRCPLSVTYQERGMVLMPSL